MLVANFAADLAAALAPLAPPDGFQLAPLAEPDADLEVAGLAVALVNTAGQPPIDYLGAGSEPLQQPELQVRVRSAPEDYAQGDAKAREMLGAIHNLPLPGYVSVRCESSAPSYFGPDHLGRHRFSFNVQAQRR